MPWLQMHRVNPILVGGGQKCPPFEEVPDFDGPSNFFGASFRANFFCKSLEISQIFKKSYLLALF